MNFQIIPSKTFLRQLEKVDEKSKKIISDKIQLIKENPFRYKKIYSKSFSKVFRIRLKIQSKETRMIYIVTQKIILVCLLDRKKDYKDLEKYLSKIT
ncbi:MAG: hypothetical protein ABFQ65_00505 [Nanoarchaeota archaeon]